MGKYDHLVLCGSVSIDRIMSFNGIFKDHIHPDKIDVISLSILMDSLVISNGGIAGNIAYSLSLLKQKSIILASVGSDAKSYINLLKKKGVDTRQVRVSELPTSSFTVITDSKGNQVGGFYPGAMKDNADLSLKAWHKTKSFIVISANDPEAMRREVFECKKYKLPYLYDVSQQASNIPPEDILSGIEGAQIVIVNDYEKEVILKRMQIKEEKLIKLCPVFITTKGENGSLIEGKEVQKKIIISAVKPVKVIDPTGAGDSYRAGFLYGLNQGLSLETCAMMGATLASFVIEHRGTQLHNLSKKEFKQRFKNTFKQSITL